MTQRAIIVGVQDYAFKPLTAPAKDARDVRDALTALGIFARDEILLLVDDGTAADVDGPASRDAILDALEPLYDQQDCSRLFFYFSGHGASWRVSSGASVLKPVLLCHGVNRFGKDGRAMIDVEELLERFRMRGPDEQIWVIDACRNIPESEGRPVVGTTTWEDKPPVQVRRRALVYAVAPLAQAAAIQGKNSVFTREFLEGLAGKGRAAIYEPATDSWIVTHRSICDYAQARLETGMAEWEKAFKLPRVEFESDPPPRALRTLSQEGAPRPRPVSLKVDPEAASTLVSARLKREGATPAQWPPHRASSPLAPAVYRFEAELAVDPGWDRLEPVTALIDTRETDEIIVNVSRRPFIKNMITGGGDEVVEVSEQPGGAGLVEIGRRKKGGKRAKVRIETAERSIQFSATLHGTATIPMDLGPERIPGDATIWRIDSELAPGLWRIEARLAEETLGTIDIDLEAGAVVDLRLVASMPTALRFAARRGAVRAFPPRAPALLISETMGPINGAVLPSVLPLLALKAFDQGILTRLETPWLKRVATKPGDAPVGVAVAVDGPWDGLPVPVVGSISLRIAGEGPPGARRYDDEFGLAVLAHASGPPEAMAAAGGTPGSNLATLRVPGWGQLEFAVPRIPNRIACIGVALRAGGRFELSVASLAAHPGDPASPYRQRGETARAVAIGARLLGTGTSDRQAVSEAAYGKWMDPVLGALAWHAINDRGGGHPRGGRETIARNMFAAFPSLADSLILLHWLTRRQETAPNLMPPAMARDLDRLLRESLIEAAPSGSVQFFLEGLHKAWGARLPRDAQGPADRLWRPRHLGSVFAQQPVLAASVDALADLAEEAGAPGHWAVRRRALIEPGAVWNVVFSGNADGGTNG